MFNDKIVKLKKEQFVEAESIAYLIENEEKRKLAFLNICAIFAFKNYTEKNKYRYDAITNVNLFRVPAVYEKFEISDVYIGDARIDVRVCLDGKVFPIPKVHIQNSIAADFYVVYKATKNPLKCEALGYIKKEDLVFDSQDNEYYYISVNILNPIGELKNEADSFVKTGRAFYETEHKIATEHFGAFLDEDLDEIKSQDLVEHLLACEVCRGKFVEYSFLEDVLTAMKYYPDLKENLENYINQENAQTEEKSEFEQDLPENNQKEFFVEEMTSEEPSTEEPYIEESYTEEQYTMKEDLPEEITQGEAEMGAIPTEEQVTQDVIPQEEIVANEDLIELEDNSIIDFTAEENGLLIDEENIVEEKEQDYAPTDGNEYMDLSGSSIIEEDKSSTEITTENENPAIQELEKMQDEEKILEEENSIIDNISIESPTIFELDEQKSDNGEIQLDVNDKQEISVDEISDIVFDNNSDTSEIKDFSIELPFQNEENLAQAVMETPIEEITSETNWNELFSGSTKPKNIEDSEPELYVDNKTDKDKTDNIETIYSEENVKSDMSEEEISNEIKTHVEKTKSPAGVAIALSIALVSVIIIAGGLMIFNKSSKEVTNNQNSPIESYTPTAGESENMNQAMTNAFSDEQNTLEVRNVSWQKSEKTVLTTELKEYLSALGGSIWDDLEVEIQSVQGYIASNPVKILIKINEKGEVSEAKIRESSGAAEIDTVILKTVKDNAAKMPPSSYSITGQNISLILLVNF